MLLRAVPLCQQQSAVFVQMWEGTEQQHQQQLFFHYLVLNLHKAMLLSVRIISKTQHPLSCLLP